MLEINADRGPEERRELTFLNTPTSPFRSAPTSACRM
jgi:hypothetical protein